MISELEKVSGMSREEAKKVLLEDMLDDAKRTPLKAMLTTPSCVPAVPGFEDTGSFIGPEEVAETMKWKECVGLGEMMNFPGILSSTASFQRFGSFNIFGQISKT